MKVQSLPLAFGDAGTAQTIAAMRRLIEEGKKDPLVHETAAVILRQAGVPAFDWMGEARAIYHWVQQHIRFTRDVHGKETLHSAREILRLGIGDCDDTTILICALLETIGHKCRIVTIAGDEEDPSQFTHVYPEAFIDRRWVPLDVARRNSSFAAAPAHYFRKRLWDTSSGDYVDVAGLGRGPAPHRARGTRLGQYPPGRAPSAWRSNVFPPFRRVRSTPFLGVGHYGRPAMRSIGVGQDDGIDWGITLPDIIQTATQGTAQIIGASRASPYNIFPSYPSGAGAGYPYPGTTYPVGYPYSGIFSGISPTTWLIGGGILLAILMARR